MNKTLRLLSLQVSKHLRCFRPFLLTLLLCGFMQTMAQKWTDSNGITWSFTVNGTEATDIKFYCGTNPEKIYLYGDPSKPEEVSFQPAAWDAAAMRFSSTEGEHLPTIPDDVYFGLKTLIFDVSDVTNDFDLKVMNGWWSNTYYDHVKWENGLNELQITEVMAKECAKGGEGYDLDLMLYSGSMTFNAVYYESGEVPATVVIPAKVYAGSTELTVTSIGCNAFRGCTGLTNVTIPSSVTSIGERAFQSCTGLTSVTIPSSVTSIGDFAFEGCTGLTSVNIPEGVTSIGKFAFHFCRSLMSVTIPASVTSIGDSAFEECRGLTSVTIPASVTSIGNSAFCFCSGLTSVTIPEGVTSIGDWAFANCWGLTSVTIPASVTSIGDRAFLCCDGLTSISVESGNSVYDSRNNCNAIIETATNTLIAGCINAIIPEDVTSIGEWAFSYCSGLTNVTIPEGVTSIGEWAFSFCSGLTSMTIPEGVTSIGYYAFSGCSGLTTVTSLIENPFEISADVFSLYNYDTGQNVFTSATLCVPVGTKSLYEATPAWNQFQNIVELDMEPIDQGETINFGNDINGGTDLNGNVVGDIYYNISVGDGSYNAAEGCIVVTTPTDDSAISGQDIFGEDFKAGFTGIVFKVPTGKGTVKVEAQTTGTMVLKVKIGDNDPIEMELEGRLKVSFPYNVTEPTYVYIYGGTTSAAPDMAGRAAGSGELKLYGIEVSPDATGIESLTPTLSQGEGAWYTLDGRMLQGEPTQKGVYVRNGRKVVIK